MVNDAEINRFLYTVHMYSEDGIVGAGRAQRDMGGSHTPAQKLGWPAEVHQLCRAGAQLTEGELAAAGVLRGLLTIANDWRTHAGNTVFFKSARLVDPRSGAEVCKMLFKVGDPTLDSDGLLISGYEIHAEDGRPTQLYQQWRIRFLASTRDVEGI